MGKKYFGRMVQPTSTRHLVAIFQQLLTRIPGVLAVDVCTGFAVTTMCLSCEKNAMFQNLQQQSMGQTCGWQSKVSK